MYYQKQFNEKARLPALDLLPNVWADTVLYYVYTIVGECSADHLTLSDSLTGTD